MDKKESAELERQILISDLQSPDEVVRTRALGALCPCRKGWELFEQNVKSIYKLTKNKSRTVRAGALLADAVLLQSIEDAEYRFQMVEDVLHKKHGSSRGREAHRQVRRSGRFKRRKGTIVLR